MKTCPRCNRIYPDTENFCEDDRTQLVSEPAFTRQDERIECPTCGGKADPGEVTCRYCGTRLEDTPPADSPPSMGQTRTTVIPSSPSPYPRLTPSQTGTPPPNTGRMAPPTEETRRSPFLIVGYVIAAVIALAAGAWFAIQLNTSKSSPVAGGPSPSSIGSPATSTTGPVVVLANALPVQVSGPASASPDRSTDVIRKAFDDNSGSLVDTYNAALATDPKIADGMLIRLHIRADGTVENSAVRTSTSPDPSLDAKVVSTMGMWRLNPTKAGDVDADYPIIFAHDSAEASRLEGELQTRIANLSPTETPEYASGAASPEATAAAAPTAEAGRALSAGVAEAPSPAVAPPTPVAEGIKKSKPHHTKVARPAPTPSIFDQVNARLKANPKLRRVKTYTNGGTVTLFGKVFGEAEKSLAVETVRNIPGVTNVVNNITTDEGDWAAQQATIMRQLANAGLDKVTVKVIGHDAFLDGEVKTELDKSRAVTVTEGAAPVTVRTNIIRVVPGSMFGF